MCCHKPYIIIVHAVSATALIFELWAIIDLLILLFLAAQLQLPRYTSTRVTLVAACVVVTRAIAMLSVSTSWTLFGLLVVGANALYDPGMWTT